MTETSAFPDIRVLDLSTRLSGAFCARLFADYGARVLLAEPPGGHPLRYEPPFAGGVPGPDRSLLHAYANASKQSTLVPGPTTAEFAEMVRYADVVVVNDREAVPSLAATNPSALISVITPYGLTGPLAGAPGNDLTAYARSGWALLNGDPGEPPLKGSHNQAGYLAGLLAFVATAAALRHRDQTGEGQTVDTSELEALTLVAGPNMLVARYAGANVPRQPVDMVRGPVECKDGYFSLTISRAQFWRDAMTMLGLHDLAEDERYNASSYRRQMRGHYSGRVEAELKKWTRWDLFDGLSAVRCVAGVVLDTRELLENPHLAARGFFMEAEIAGLPARFPGAPFKSTAFIRELTNRAPDLPADEDGAEQWRPDLTPHTLPGTGADLTPDPLSGAERGQRTGGLVERRAVPDHQMAQAITDSLVRRPDITPPATQEERARRIAAAREQAEQIRISPDYLSGQAARDSLQSSSRTRTANGSSTPLPAPYSPLPAGPLSGVRALVLTQAWSGTFATELLGLLGAEVIQIEGRGRLDGWRGFGTGAIPAAIRDDNREQRTWNTSGLYNAVNLNKRAITLDLADPRGKAIFERMVPAFDIVAENFTPRVMGNLGLGYADLQKLRPDIILASLSAYGATGPYANTPGIGGTIEPMSGMTSLLGYEGGRPQNSGAMYPDPVAGSYLAAAMIMALRHRDRTGAGQYIDLGMMEANATFIGDALLEAAVNGVVRPRMGNRHPRIAPHNFYQARDGWLALSADTEAAWRALTEVMQRPELAPDPRFAGMKDRKTNEAALDAEIAAWVAGQDLAELVPALLTRGISAAVAVETLDALRDPQLAARGFFVEVEHPQAGRGPQAGVPWRLSRTPAAVTRHAPMVGEHSREVFAEFLGMEDAEYEELVAAGVTGEQPFSPDA